MKTALVVVSHNSKEDLEASLPFFDSKRSGAELVVIDNSDDVATRDFLKAWGGNVIFTQNRGFGAACNLGAKMTSSEFLVFLNPDIVAHEGWLDELLVPFGDPSVAVVGARLFNAAGKEYPTPKENFAVGACFAVRREVFDKLGDFDEKFFLFFEETDFCVRAVAAGYKVVRSEAQLIHLHPHFPPFTGVLKKHWDESEAYFKSKHTKPQVRQDLALVMIVKNEEVGLERAILSCRDFVSEIVIAVDNASTDRTAIIAEKYATTLKRFDFLDDFSRARNFAHQGVKTKWILFLDGHEYVTEARDLKKMLEFEGDGLMCQVIMDNGMIFGNPRIYRSGVQFKGRIHERQQCKNVTVYPGFKIKHARIGGQAAAAVEEREKQRDYHVAGIMAKEYKGNKKNIRAAFHLALHTQSRGKVRQAMRWWKRYLKYSSDVGERWYAFFNISLCQLAMGHLFRAFWYADKAEGETPGRWEVQKLKGLIYFNRKRYAEAAEFFVGSFGVNTGVISYLPWPRDDAGTFSQIGECLFNQGVYDRASMAFAKAAESCEDEKFKKLYSDRSALMLQIAGEVAKAVKN